MPRFHRMLAFAIVVMALAPALSAQQPAPAPTRPDLLFREELRDRRNYVGLTGLARLRAIVRTQALHVLHPVVKLADGSYAAGSRTIVGLVDLMPSGGHGNAGWSNISAVELYAKAVPRTATSSR